MGNCRFPPVPPPPPLPVSPLALGHWPSGSLAHNSLQCRPANLGFMPGLARAAFPRPYPSPGDCLHIRRLLPQFPTWRVCLSPWKSLLPTTLCLLPLLPQLCLRTGSPIHISWTIAAASATSLCPNTLHPPPGLRSVASLDLKSNTCILPCSCSRTGTVIGFGG